MRYSFSQLQQQSADICIDDTSQSFTSLTSTPVYIKREINNTVSFIYRLLREYKLQPPAKTVSTVASTTYYDYPAGFSKLESAAIDIGSHTPPLKVVHSQVEWDRLTQIDITAGFPTHIFPRQYDFGLYPTPSAIYTVYLTGNFKPIPMTEDDYTAGTVSLTNGDATVTGSGTTFTSAMENRFFVITDSSGNPIDNWYRIEDFTDTTHFELSRTYEGTTASSLNYIIAQSPEIPEELHEFIPYMVGSNYYMTRQKDLKQAKAFANYFYTGDYDNPNRRGSTIKGGVLAVLHDFKERGRDNSQLVETMGGNDDINFVKDGIWGLTLS